MASPYVRLDPSAIHQLLTGDSGPVVRRLLEDGELVRQEAKRLVGVSRPRPGERRQREHGALRASIVKRLAKQGDTVVVQVGSDDPVALWHHEGTQPHAIRAKNAPMLVFYWAKVGHVVAFKQVSHPGTKPNRFLINALAILRGRY